MNAVEEKFFFFFFFFPCLVLLSVATSWGSNLHILTNYGSKKRANLKVIHAIKVDSA